ncbi:type I phosphomannose isomerase catalytic subunit [Thermogemmatispora sp.]|uniref:type I phosphomannose isomerase catalytic subunit n=1 Tax=Thermogemmatispora sp. TaxID=1968838 RepID=UPI001D82E652|nr:type I phosphomannose isomerase catalytic subunit [Thermogemmatispora sp.]MBX5451777.1 class I mannose-6-phosphate isomerase [Thermogemmatispora sp.]
MESLHPILLEASLHETIWGGRRLEEDGWKKLPPAKLIGEAWETEVNTLAQNPPYVGKTLGQLTTELGPSLLGPQTAALFGSRFPLLAKFIDAHQKLSVQVHPDDAYAAQHEGGKLGKTECWYILAAEPGATIIHGFAAPTSRSEVAAAIENVQLERLLHEEPVNPGDVIFVPAGTVHAIGAGILLYELQEYSDITYRMYDYGRLTAEGKPRELHIESALAVAHYGPSARIKVRAVPLPSGPGYEERCLVACRYFVLRELTLRGEVHDQPAGSCQILSSLGAEVTIHYGPAQQHRLSFGRGQSVVLPAALGPYRLEGQGVLLRSYVPAPTDFAWLTWKGANPELA